MGKKKVRKEVEAAMLKRRDGGLSAHEGSTDKSGRKGTTQTPMARMKEVNRVSSAEAKLSKSQKKKMAKKLTNDLDSLGLLMSGNSSSASTERVQQTIAKTQLAMQMGKKKRSKGALRKKKRKQKLKDAGETFADKMAAKLEKINKKALTKTLAK
eukprot:m.4621 g.4621  ORF g.4621 m.4621 type:complete len:155 (+) comp3942_c0_seq1:154-618(+)